MTQASTTLSIVVPGRSGGRNRERLRDAAALGLSAGRGRPRRDAREPLEPAHQPRLPDRRALPAHDDRRGDGGAGDGGVRRRGDPRRRDRRAGAGALQPPHGRRDRRGRSAGGELDTLPPAPRPGDVGRPELRTLPRRRGRAAQAPLAPAHARDASPAA